MGEAAPRLSTGLNLKPKIGIGKFGVYFCFHANVFSASTIDERKQTSTEAQDVLLRVHQLGTRIRNIWGASSQRLEGVKIMTQTTDTTRKYFLHGNNF
jgi:hypothetical protein